LQAFKLRVSKISLPLRLLQPKCVQVSLALIWLRLGPNHSQTLTDGNFAAHWPTDPILPVWKDLRQYFKHGFCSLKVTSFSLSLFSNRLVAKGLGCIYSVGSKPTFWRAEPSFLIRWIEPSRAFFRKDELSQAELFAFKSEPNQAFGFLILSYFWLFSVEFFKRIKIFSKKNTLLLMSSGLYQIGKNVGNQLIFSFSM